MHRPAASHEGSSPTWSGGKLRQGAVPALVCSGMWTGWPLRCVGAPLVWLSPWVLSTLPVAGWEPGGLSAARVGPRVLLSLGTPEPCRAGRQVLGCRGGPSGAVLGVLGFN